MIDYRKIVEREIVLCSLGKYQQDVNISFGVKLMDVMDVDIDPTDYKKVLRTDG